MKQFNIIYLNHHVKDLVHQIITKFNNFFNLIIV